MSGNTRQFVAVGIVALVLGAALVGAGVVIADTGGPGAGPARATQHAPGDGGPGAQTVTVSASGQAETAPDRAVVRVAVEATADDPTVARRRVAENASEMRAALVDLGLPADAVRTVDFDVYEDRVRPRERDGEPRTTYRARHAFAVEVGDTDRVGAVIDAAVDSGATRVHGVEFTLAEETRRELRQDAIDEAMAGARAQAETIAAAGGLQLAGVHSVRTGVRRGPRPVPVHADAGGVAGGGTAVEPGPVSVGAAVTVTYNATG